MKTMKTQTIDEDRILQRDRMAKEKSDFSKTRNE